MSMIFNLNKGGGGGLEDISGLFTSNTYNASNLTITMCKIKKDINTLIFKVISSLKTAIVEMKSTRHKLCELPIVENYTYPGEVTINVTYPNGDIYNNETKAEFYDPSGSSYVDPSIFANKTLRVMAYDIIDGAYDKDGNKINIAKTSHYIDLKASNSPLKIWRPYKAEAGQDYEILSSYRSYEAKKLEYEEVTETTEKGYCHNTTDGKWYKDGVEIAVATTPYDLIPANKNKYWVASNELFMVNEKVIRGACFICIEDTLVFNADYMYKCYLASEGCPVDSNGVMGFYDITNAHPDVDIVDPSDTNTIYDGCDGTAEFVKEHKNGMKTMCRATIENNVMYVDGNIVLSGFEIEGAM